MFDDSDYIVEHYIKPKKVTKRIINDERADILGNFDDNDDKFKKKIAKQKPQIAIESEENPFLDKDESEDDVESDIEAGKNEDGSDDPSDEDELGDEELSENADENENEAHEKDDVIDEDDDETMELEETIADKTPTKQTVNVPVIEKKTKSKKNPKPESSKTNGSTLPAVMSDLSDNQIQALMRGASKKDRFVLYITNLNYSTSRDGLSDFFSIAGPVKSVRVPKVRKSAFAFVEMADVQGFKKALTLHNKTLDNYSIKVQVSEGGKKKSANKKNILKQKNRKLAEMRNEGKQFERSGKGFSKEIKKEIKQRKMQQERRIARQQKRKTTAAANRGVK